MSTLRLSWTRIADLFRAEDRFGGSTHPEAFGFVPDPADRKFAALADAVQAPLVTSDAGLLNAGGQMAVPVLKPSEFALRCGALSGRPIRQRNEKEGNPEMGKIVVSENVSLDRFVQDPAGDEGVSRGGWAV